MNAKTTLLMSALVLATGFARADDSAVHSSPLTRAEVRQAVRAAQAAGQLIPAGEVEIRAVPAQVRSSLSRKDVERDVIAAQRAGKLIPAGERELRIPVDAPTDGVTLARAQVKAETLRALAAGEIIPAGEGTNDHEARLAHASTSMAMAPSRPLWLSR